MVFATGEVTENYTEEVSSCYKQTKAQLKQLKCSQRLLRAEINLLSAQVRGALSGLNQGMASRVLKVLVHTWLHKVRAR